MRRRPIPSAQPLRIAMVAACPFPSARGSQVLIRELAETLSDAGHQVHLVTYPWGESLVPVRGVFLHRARKPRWLAARGAPRWQKFVLDACLVRTLYRVVRREGIDVIHAHNYEGPLISYPVRWATGVPVVYHSHNALGDELACYFPPGWRKRLAQRLGEALDAQVPRRADFSIALTPELEAFLRARGVAASRVVTVAPPVTPIEGGGDADAPCFGCFTVMYAGNLDPYQDVDVLVAGFERLRETVANALLVVVTHEANWRSQVGGRLETLARAGHARIIVAPTFAMVRRLLARADALVCPRSSWSGFPIKLLNYMAAGRPIVVAAGSAKGVVDGESGLIFRNRDSGDLASALRRLFADVALRQRLGAGAREAAAAAASWDAALSRVTAVYETLATRRPRSSAAPRPVPRLRPPTVKRMSAASANRAR